jgi:hypothetical protein
VREYSRKWKEQKGNAAADEVERWEPQSIERLKQTIQELKKPIESVAKSGAVTSYDLDFELMVLQEMMIGTPTEATMMVDACLKFVERASPAFRLSTKFEFMGNRTLAQLRPDGAVYSLLMSAIEIGRARSVAGFAIDETEVEKESIESLIATIVDEYRVWGAAGSRTGGGDTTKKQGVNYGSRKCHGCLRTGARCASESDRGVPGSDHQSCQGTGV